MLQLRCFFHHFFTQFIQDSQIAGNGPTAATVHGHYGPRARWTAVDRAARAHAAPGRYWRGAALKGEGSSPQRSADEEAEALVGGYRYLK